MRARTWWYRLESLQRRSPRSFSKKKQTPGHVLYHVEIKLAAVLVSPSASAKTLNGRTEEITTAVRRLPTDLRGRTIIARRVQRNRPTYKRGPWAWSGLGYFAVNGVDGFINYSWFRASFTLVTTWLQTWNKRLIAQRARAQCARVLCNVRNLYYRGRHVVVAERYRIPVVMYKDYFQSISKTVQVCCMRNKEINTYQHRNRS